MRHGGKILTNQLEAHGASAAFTVPGESFLAALDGLHDSNQIRTITCRQEGGASMMAEAHAKMTGKPGVCFVTRGPGAANAMSGLHIAQQDSTPLVTLVGMPGADFEDREAFQEIEIKQLFGSFVKWAAVIRSTDRIPEYMSRAFHVAQSGRPGPVVLGLPEDMLAEANAALDAQTANPTAPAPNPADIAALSDGLAKAQRPLMIVGGPGWSKDIQSAIQRFAERFDLPVAAAFRYQDYFDNRHPNYVGHAGIGLDPTLGSAIKEADLLIVMGARLGEMTTSGYSLLSIPNPSQTLVHVHPSPDELGSVYRADIAITSSAGNFAAALDQLSPAGPPTWSERTKELRQAQEKVLEPRELPGDVKLGEVIRSASDMLPDDAIICNGAGNYAAFLHRHFTYKGYRTQLAPTSGSMGYGLPAAIGAKVAEPQRTVVAFAGDGCFMMTSQELATAMQYGLPVITIVVNNSMLGTIRAHQERQYPERVSATTLMNPDFAAYAKAFGANGLCVKRTEDFKPALAEALASNSSTLIEVQTDPEAISPRQTLTEVRASGQS